MGERLGPYDLEKRIGAGGMADVFLARGPRGVCVIKRPHAHLCANPEFVRMFLDEAAILAQLNHPNIAQIFDLGHIGGVYYLAMEYVPGFDLMTISLEHERQGELMAPELCARIVADAAGALHYAHEAKGRDGVPLNIIHRDVSPHNILLSTQGIVKLIDFGVAKASTAMHRTQAGLVKGKYPYMSPEQITGQPIDRRVDVYALGLVLYELLTNTRAIEGANEVEQIDNARAAKIRPIEQLRPNLPVPMRQIVAGCLHPSPDARYPTALHLKEDLEKYGLFVGQKIGQEDLLRLFRVVAAEVSHLDAPADSPMPPGAETWLPPKPTEIESSAVEPESFSPTVPSMPTPAPIKLGSAMSPGSPLATDLAARASVPSSAEIPTDKESIDADLAGAIPRRSSAGFLIAGVGFSVLAAAGVAYMAMKPSKQGTEIGATAVVEVVDSGSTVAVAPPTPTVADVVDAGAVAEQEDVDSGAAEETTTTTTPTPSDPGDHATSATLFVKSTPQADVTVDKQAYGRSPQQIQLAPGRHTVQLSDSELNLSRVTVVTLRAGEQKPLNIVSERFRIGISVEPFGNLKIDGVEVMSAASFKEVELWTGRHSIEAWNPELPNRVKRYIDVKENQTLNLNLLAGQ